MTKNLLLLILLFSLAMYYAMGQNSFFKAYDINVNGNAHSILLTSNHDIIVGGRVEGDITAPTKAMVMRLHENGDTVWTKILFNPDYNMRVRHLVLGTDSNVVALADAQGSSVSTQGFTYIHITKFNGMTGDTLWTMVTGAAGTYSNLSVHSIDNTLDGGYIISATMENNFNNTPNAALLRIDGSGNVIWRKSYSINTLTFLSSSGSVKHTADGGFIYAAFANQSRAGDILLLKTDSAGDVAWSKLLGQHYGDGASDIIVTSDNNYLLLGSTYVDSIYHNNVFLSKVDFSGNVLWTKTYGTTALYGDVGMRVSETPGGDYIFGGGLQPAIDTYYPSIIKTDANGDTLWTFMPQDSSVFYFFCDVVETSDGGYISGCNQRVSQFLVPLALAKIDSAGEGSCFQLQYPIATASALLTDTAHTLQLTQLLPPAFPSFTTQVAGGFSASTICPVPAAIFADNSGDEFILYPNLVKDDLTIHLPASEPGTMLAIYDAAGKQLFHSFITEQNSKINISGFDNGLYILEIISKKNILRQKFIKQ